MLPGPSALCFQFVVFCIAVVTSSVTLTSPSRDNKQKRIAGGEEAAEGDFPWQVRLRSFGQVTYSGVLVGYNWVLTAASCFDGNYHPSLWNAVLGDYNSANQDLRERSVFVEDIFIYGGFTGDNAKDNIALVKLRLDQVAALDVQFSPVPVADGREDLSSACFLTGWGATASGQESSARLRRLKMTLLNSTSCQAMYGIPVDAKQLCSFNIDTHIGPCTGDRGSPVLCLTGDEWNVVGVVSEEYACQSNQTPPGTFTNVAFYSQWINKIMAKF